ADVAVTARINRIAFVVNAGVLPGGEGEEAGLGVVGGGVPVGGALDAGPGADAAAARLGAFVAERAALVVEAGRPGDGGERLSQQELAVRSVEHVEEAVAVAPQHELARASVPVAVGEHGDLHGVVVPDVVGRELEVPTEL